MATCTNPPYRAVNVDQRLSPDASLARPSTKRVSEERSMTLSAPSANRSAERLRLSPPDASSIVVTDSSSTRPPDRL